MTVSPRPDARRGARAVAAYRALRARQRRLDMWLERRFPTLYDARHAARAIGSGLWPLVGPLLTALVLVPLVAVLATLVAVLDLDAPSLDLPAVDLPDIPLPDVSVPDWLRAIGPVIGVILAAFGAAAKYLVVALAIVFGVRRTREVRRKRIAAQQIGRPELMRRLVVVLRAVEAAARARDDPAAARAEYERDRDGPS